MEKNVKDEEKGPELHPGNTNVQESGRERRASQGGRGGGGGWRQTRGLSCHRNQEKTVLPEGVTNCDKHC